MDNNENLIKLKGPAKDFATEKWFVEQLGHLDKITEVHLIQPFIPDWNQLMIRRKEYLYNLGTPESHKKKRPCQ